MKKIVEAMFILSISALVSAQDSIRVEDSNFALFVDSNTKEPSNVIHKFIDQRPPLYFWTKVSGTEDAWSKLVATKKLPIRHKWEKFVGSRFRLTDDELAKSELDEIMSLQFTETISTDIDEENVGTVVNGLQREMDALGKFTFRTWTNKENLGSGVYRVTVFYDDNEPVMCGDGRPCTYQICVNYSLCDN